MNQANFAYGSGGEAIACVAGVGGTDPSKIAELRQDATLAGLEITSFDLMAELDEVPPSLPRHLLLLECRILNAEAVAALNQLDSRAMRSDVQIVITTSFDALDTVFLSLSQCKPVILVEPTKGERVVAITIALTKVAPMRVRDLNEDDRRTIDRLTEQVAQIAAQIDRLSSAEPRAFKLESPGGEFRGDSDEERKLIRPPRPPLPDPRLVRRIIRQRQLRAQLFDPELFADPAWDILLDLTAARAEHVRVSVTSLCIASGVPPTTALRWIGQMTEAGLLERVEDDSDRRRAFIQLSDRAADAMARYFAELGKDARSLI